ncbi:helix-turn-helix transcriptional regulator [Herbiconiux sp. P18]|uniref:helix-turn-helix transcriptional regulator n=1 Tax=Herbiconiux liangxiaofengii TaxID=3342795 RepID=UPI003CF088E2
MEVIDPDLLLEGLEAAGVIDVIDQDGDLRCRVRDPIVELHLPHTIGRLRRRRLSSAIVRALSDRPAEDSTKSDLLAIARLALPLGWEVNPEALTTAAETALRASRVDLAARLATAAIATGAPVEASFVLSAAESQSGRSEEALARLESLQVDETAEPRRARTRRELIRLVTARVSDPTMAWSLPDRPFEPGGSHGDSAGLTGLTTADADDRRRVEGALASGSIVDHAAVLEGERNAFEASLAVMQGRSHEAIAMLTRAESMLRDAGADTFRVRWGQAYSRLWDQPFGTTYDELSVLADEAASLGQAEQEVLCRWSAALTLGHAGKAAEAVSELRCALTTLEELDLAEAALLARVALSEALAALGHSDEADAVLAPVLEVSADKPLVDGWAHEARGWVLRGSGRVAEAAEAFMTAASLHGALGFSLSQIIALSAAARTGAALQVIDTIDALADTVDGRCVALLVRQARAEASITGRGGPELAAEFDDVGLCAVDLGMHGHAAEAYSRAAELHRAAGGDPRAAAASARLAAGQASICGTTLPDVPGAAASAGLSLREKEIVLLATAGSSNREIADRLVLSVRTVETHLLRAFRKLGVRRRSDLAAAMEYSTPGMAGGAGALHSTEAHS